MRPYLSLPLSLRHSLSLCRSPLPLLPGPYPSLPPMHRESSIKPHCSAFTSTFRIVAASPAELILQRHGHQRECLSEHPTHMGTDWHTHESTRITGDTCTCTLCTHPPKYARFFICLALNMLTDHQWCMWIEAGHVAYLPLLGDGWVGCHRDTAATCRRDSRDHRPPHLPW